MAKFKVGDTVALIADAGAWRKDEKGTVLGGDYLPGYLYVEFDGGTKGRIPEDKLAASNARAANANFEVGDKVKVPDGKIGTVEKIVTFGGATDYLVRVPGRSMESRRAEELVAANARVANARWVIMYRDGGKERIEAPSHAEAKKIAEAKSKKSGRGYTSVIVDDGVDYDRWQFFNSRACNSTNPIVRKAMNAQAVCNAGDPGHFTSDELSALKGAFAGLNGASFSQYPNESREQLAVRGENGILITVQKFAFDGKPAEFDIRGQGPRSGFGVKFASSIREAVTTVKRMLASAKRQSPYSFGKYD